MGKWGNETELFINCWKSKIHCTLLSDCSRKQSSTYNGASTIVKWTDTPTMTQIFQIEKVLTYTCESSRKQSVFLNIERRITWKERLRIAVLPRVLSITVKHLYARPARPASLLNFAFLLTFGKEVSSDNKTDNSQIDTWYYINCMSFCFLHLFWKQAVSLDTRILDFERTMSLLPKQKDPVSPLCSFKINVPQFPMNLENSKRHVIKNGN